MKHFTFGIAAAMALGLAALTAQPQPASAMSGWYEPNPDPKNCENDDGALDDAAFVIVMTPRAGDRVRTGFGVTGCSRTFESNVQWKLIGADGSELASGHTSGGGVDGAGTFDFDVTYEVDKRQVGHLEVMGEDASDGEGNPPGRTVLPLVLQQPEGE
ncbi:Gmad2 immunoglobulin-like domain-containing protein [Methyloligella solikamskensis]|uniref:Gmad2 immunoglobulin-like domain-containing protein n=1 Tax=Methyloligella solikamskensis TaxID=1177756 RepID=A0ABW3JBL7_9HYPH